MGRVLGERHRQSRAQDPRVDSMEAQRDAAPFLGDAVAVRARQALDQASQPQSAQVVGGTPRRLSRGLYDTMLMILSFRPARPRSLRILR